MKDITILMGLHKIKVNLQYTELNYSWFTFYNSIRTISREVKKKSYNYLKTLYPHGSLHYSDNNAYAPKSYKSSKQICI